jgi:prevent-host-death family protein
MADRSGRNLYEVSVYAIIWYMTTIPVADARSHLSKLIDEATATHQRFEITRNGHRAAVLLSADDFDTLQDTIAVLSDPTLLSAHQEGQAAIEAGDYLDADQLAHKMREARRLPR